jgi:hypothetical protein
MMEPLTSSLKAKRLLPANYFELSLLVLPADIATVNPDRKRTIGSRKFILALLAAAGIGPNSDCFV